MGAGLCSCRQPSTTDDHHDDDGDHTSSAITGLIVRPCRNATVGPAAEKRRSRASRVATLEDWLMKSPSLCDHKPDYDVGESYVKHDYRKVHPSSSSNRVSYCNLGSGSREDDVASLVRRSKSERSDKTVSFKEEPDIVYVYSPEEASCLD